MAVSFCASAQTRDGIRDTYVQSYKDHFFIWPVLKQKRLNFDIKRDKQSLRYQPNNSYTVGLGAYVFDLALEVTFAIPINKKNEEIFGESKARDFQINALSRKWGADLFYQKYTGFYTTDQRIFGSTGDQPYPQRPDISTRNFGLTGVYVFNDKKYSMKSAFNFSERQLESGGSFLITGTLNSFKLTADSAVIDPSLQPVYGVNSDFNTLRHTTFSVAPGYAYNYILNNFFVSGALMVGPAHNWIYYKSVGQPENNDIGINAFAFFRFGVGYSNDRFFAGLNFVSQSRVARFDEMQFTNSTSTFRLLVGLRFREVGILKKSVWELPQKLLTL